MVRFFLLGISWLLVDFLSGWQGCTFRPRTSHECRSRECTIHIVGSLLKEYKKQNANTQYRSFLTKDGVVDIDEQGWGTFTCFANDVQVWVKVNETAERLVASDEAEEVMVSFVVCGFTLLVVMMNVCLDGMKTILSPWHSWLFVLA